MPDLHTTMAPEFGWPSAVIAQRWENPVEIRHGMTFQQPQAAVFQVYRWCNPPTRGMATSLGRAAFLRSIGLVAGVSLSSESWIRSS